ncbi:hypothetical protein A6A19_01080 [Actinobacillus delphinicola]|uniref:Mov34/MPN/PAD-1 family protein n=1 Tax=Actinobacillus delphinicola TaxID=51161 RepID=UPI0024426F5D|nr:Mov34/MPN/PAD-1 family protein [Actinobacillus delphinicola]MDG6896622.1 hypothetical protein [Actinobacillus delphinicola]
MYSDIIVEVEDIKIKIGGNILFLMEKYKQYDSFSKEGGGILIGKENLSNANIIIDNLTEPYSEDIRKRRKFIRMDLTHIHVFKKLYELSNRTYRYIGEWHSHPEYVPEFSEIDFKNWIDICKKGNNLLNSYYHMIVGIKAIGIWYIDSSNYRVKLLKKIYWEDMNIIEEK